MEIKGIIELGENLTLTCCESLQDLRVNGKSLYNLLNNFFDHNAEEYWENCITQTSKYSVKYVVLDKKPKE